MIFDNHNFLKIHLLHVILKKVIKNQLLQIIIILIIVTIKILNNLHQWILCLYLNKYQILNNIYVNKNYKKDYQHFQNNKVKIQSVYTNNKSIKL